MEDLVIGSLTTIPSRLKYLKNTIKSLLSQTRPLDKIYISVPYHCRKNNQTYDAKLLEELENIDPKIQILRFDEDLGPVMKLKGVLTLDLDDEVKIITFDDDTYYDPRLVEKLLYYSKKYPNAALSCYGISIGKFPFYISLTVPEEHYVKSFIGLNDQDKIDICGGVFGALYQKKFFNKTDPKLESLWKENVTLQRNDDVYISAWLSANNIDRRIVIYEDNSSYCLESGNIEALHNMDGSSSFGAIIHAYQFIGLLNTMTSLGYFQGRTQNDPLNYLGFWIMIGIALLISIVCCLKMNI